MDRRIVLHALGSADGTLLLWAEDSGRLGSRRHGRFHPLALDASSLERLLAPALGRITASSLPLTLPVSGDPRLDAQASPFLTSTPCLPPGEAVTQPFEVPAAAFMGADLLEELPLLTHESAPWHPADSLLYWNLVGRLTLQVLESGRFLPRVESQADYGGHAARVTWGAAWHDSELLAALSALARTAPRAATRMDGHGDVMSATRAFVDEAVTHVVRAHASERSVYSTSELFVQLAGEDSTTGEYTPQADKNALADIGGWSAEVDATPSAATAKTQLRLQLKAPSMPRGEALPAASAIWKVSFALQSKETPSLRLDVSDLWENDEAAIDFGQVVATNPAREFAGLIEELSEIWPAALTHRGGVVELDNAGLSDFLATHAGAAETAGFIVDLPSGWDRVHKLKATVKGTGPSAGIFTMKALFNFDITVAAQNLNMTVETLAEMAARRVPLVMSQGQWVRFDPKHVARMLAALQQFESATVGDALMASADLAEIDEDLDITFHSGLWLDSFLSTDHATLASLPLGSLPHPFRKTLKHWQESGISWMHRMEQLGIHSCLADDMGLGKSRQLLGLLLAEREDPEVTPTATLLVAPASVLKDWRTEVEKAAPALELYVHHGLSALRGRELRDAVGSADIVLTTYDTHAGAPELLSQFEWWRLALDESHLAKNPASRRASALREIVAQRRLALTGTPMLNRLDELWALMSFLNPGLLGSRQSFRQRFVNPINAGDTEMQEKLRQLVRPFFLRRHKTDADIAPYFKAKRVVHHLEWQMTAEQAALYQACMAKNEPLLKAAEGALDRHTSVMELINQLRGICNHPGQYLGWEGELAGRSGKVREAERIIKAARAKGEKTLLFVFYAKKLGPYLAAHLEKQLGCEVPIFAGGMTDGAKSRLRDRFASDPDLPVLIVSQGAGANGMNMTAANHVIHFDRSWSPGIEDQCSDRALRLDQKEDVHVYTLTCPQAPIEVLIAATHMVKSALNQATFGGKEALMAMDDDELFDALAMSQSLTQPLTVAA